MITDLLKNYLRNSSIEVLSGVFEGELTSCDGVPKKILITQ